jgi:hypothetical protein
MPNDATITTTRTFTAVARCASCAWAARLSGDSDVEVVAFLRALLMAHVQTTHEHPSQVQ